MTQGSLKLRLFLAGALSIAVALALAGFGLLLLFERHVERRMTVELEAHLRQLVGGLERVDGMLQLHREPADSRFLEPLSGLYWQVADETSGAVLRSRSLWDLALALPPDTLIVGEVHAHVIEGPNNASLLAVERTVVLPTAMGGGAIRAAVAIDRAEVHAAGREFATDLAPSLLLLAAVLTGAAWIQVVVGLKPLDTVRQKLAHVRTGKQARLGSEFPDEVRPLTLEVDHLLDAQDEAVARARARAADLAHGLKTPLTILDDDVRQLRKKGEVVIANEIASLARAMQQHVERELARQRATLRATTSQPVLPVVQQVIRVLQRTPHGQTLTWLCEVPDGLCIFADRQDLTEIIGNLAENAAKWARGCVRISGSDEAQGAALVVEDDGEGVPPSEVNKILARGGRLDTAKSGTGLGLAIVSDAMEAYGGSLELERSDLGGLRATLRFPGRTESTRQAPNSS